MSKRRGNFGATASRFRRSMLGWLGVVALVALGLGVADSAKADDAKAERRAAIIGCQGTYNAPPRSGAEKRVDIPQLLDELIDQRANTYHWLIWHRDTDWDDLKRFLPKAREKNIKVWVTVSPPSEQPPKHPRYSEPFRLDFERWAVEIAKLSVDEPNLVAWSFDDFTHNLKDLSPKRVNAFIKEARAINPKLAFVPCSYFPRITEKFIKDYGESLDGILFPYRAESGKPNLTDASLVAEEVAKLKAIPGAPPIIIDVYATRHSRLGDSTPDYVRQVMAAGHKAADGVLVYCHQNPRSPAQIDKYNVIKELFHEWAEGDR